MNTELRPLVILLVEDEETDVYLVKWALGINEISVDLHHVFDGQQALEFMRRFGLDESSRPNLILLDLSLPRMSGLECLAAIKQEPGWCDIPVVVLSASYNRSDMDAALKLGAADFISKPIDRYQLAEAVRVMGECWISSKAPEIFD